MKQNKNMQNIRKVLFVVLLLTSIFTILSNNAESANLMVDGNITSYCANITQTIVTLRDQFDMVMDQKTFGPAEFSAGGDSLTYLTPYKNYYFGRFAVAESTFYKVDVVTTGDNDCKTYGSANGTITTDGSNLVVNELTIHVDTEFGFNLNAPAIDSYHYGRPTFNWSMNYSDSKAVTYQLVIRPTSAATAPIRNITVNGNGHALTAGEALPDDTYFVEIEAHDLANPITFIQKTSPMRFYVNSDEITVVATNPANNSWSNTATSINLEVNTTEAGICALNQQNDSNYSAKTTMFTTGGTTHRQEIFLIMQGENWFHIQCNSTLKGRVGPEYDLLINYDTFAPTPAGASITIDNDATYSLDTTLNVNWSGFADVGNGISHYFVGITNNQGTSNGQQVAGTSTTLTNMPQGNVNVYVWAEDNVGNIGQAASELIIVDTLPPMLSNIAHTNLNGHSTGAMTVTLNISDSSPLLANPTVRYRKFGGAWSADQAMTRTGGSIQTGEFYSFDIPNSNSPNRWIDHINQSVEYVITGIDLHGRTSMYSGNETIDFSFTPPILEVIPSQTVWQLEQLRINITGYDNDVGEVTTFFSNTSGVSIQRITPTTATLTWTPSVSYSGPVHIAVSITDGMYNTTRTLTVNVLNINDAPTIETSKLSYTTYVYEKFNITLNATDLDGDAISWKTNSSDFTISHSGEISIYPGWDLRGENKFNVTASDPNGSSNTAIFTVTVSYCGDATCDEDYEACGTCSKDCGVCGEKEGSAIIIYPRNCLDKNMTIQAVKLVQRATCASPGMIVDDMEVCGNLSSEEIIIDKVSNDTFEEVTTLMSDEQGVVTFTPLEEGEYRIMLKSKKIYQTFTTKECISDTETDSAKSSITTNTGKTIEKTVERPAEIPKEIKEPISLLSILLLILGLPIILGAITTVGGAVAYGYEVRQVKQGKKTTSQFINLVDKQVLTRWFIIAQKFRKWLKGQEFLSYLIEQSKELYEKKSKLVKKKWAKLLKQLEKWGLNPNPSQKLTTVRFIDSDKITTKQKSLVMLFVANQQLHKWVKDEVTLKKLEESFKTIPHPTSLINLAKLASPLNNKVVYTDNKHHKKDTHDFNELKEALKNKVKYKRTDYTISELKKMIGGSQILITDIVSSDPSDKNNFITTRLLLTGFDEKNIIGHDFRNGKPNRKIPINAFRVAWKNARYKLVKIKAK